MHASGRVENAGIRRPSCLAIVNDTADGYTANFEIRPSVKVQDRRDRVRSSLVCRSIAWLRGTLILEKDEMA